MGSARDPDARLGRGRGGLQLSSLEHPEPDPARERWLARGSNRDEWRRLWAAVELADDFCFFGVQVGDAQAATFVAALLAQHTGQSGEALHLCRLALDPSTRVSDLLEGMRGAPRPAVVWLASDASGPELERLFLLLNQKREVVSALAQGPLVLALHPLAWASFRRCAPDFWSVHQAVFRFSPGGGQEARLESAPFESAPLESLAPSPPSERRMLAPGSLRPSVSASAPSGPAAAPSPSAPVSLSARPAPAPPRTKAAARDQDAAPAPTSAPHNRDLDAAPTHATAPDFAEPSRGSAPTKRRWFETLARAVSPRRRREGSGPRPLASSRYRLRDEDIRAPQIELFVGREAELRLLSSVLREPGAKVSITGPAGIGKTALVRNVLPWVANRYPGGVWYVPVELRGKPARPYAAALLSELLTELRPEVPPPTELDSLRRQFEVTSDRSRALFVFEDLDEPELIELLLPGPGASAIVTSRERPSRSDDLARFDRVVELAGLSMRAATELLALDDDLSPPEQAQVAVQTGGAPLGLRLASKSVMRDGELELDSLSDDARSLWPKVALFIGGFELADAEAVSGWSRDRSERALEELADRALIDRDRSKGTTGTSRYRNHAGLRARALARLPADVPERREAERAHARRVLVDWEVDPEDPNLAVAEDWLRGQLRDGDLPDEDWALLRAAVARLAAWTRGPETLMTLAEGVATTRADGETLAAIYRWRGAGAAERGETDDAIAWYVRGLETLIETHGETHPAVVAWLLALAELTSNDLSRPYIERAVQISDALGDPERGAYSRLLLAQHTDDPDASAALLHRALELATEHGDPDLLASVYQVLATSARGRGDLDAARVWLARALELDADDPVTHYALAEIAEAAGDLDGALAALAIAQRGFAAQLDDVLQAEVLYRMGGISIARGDLRRARHWLEQALALDERLDEGLAAIARVRLAEVDRLSGDLPSAVAKLARAYPNLTDRSLAVHELNACLDAANSETARAELRALWTEAGLDPHALEPDPE